MIIRIVKMVFQPSKTAEFEHLFEQRKEKIRAMPGCSHLELLQDTEQKEIYFTYSYWENAADLENYRRSLFFKETWKATKALFAAKAEAWSVLQKQIVNS